MADRQADDLAVILFKVQLLLSLAGFWSHPLINVEVPLGDLPGHVLHKRAEGQELIQQFGLCESCCRTQEM